MSGRKPRVRGMGRAYRALETLPNLESPMNELSIFIIVIVCVPKPFCTLALGFV